MSAFEVSEYRDRVRRVTTAMEQAGIDTLVVFAEGNIFYLSGYEGFSDYVPQVAILRAGDQDVTLVLREMDIHCAYPTVYLDPSRVESYPEGYIGTPARSPWEVIGARILEIAGDGRIGLEFGASIVSFRDHQNLVKVLGDRPLVDATGVVETSKIRKSPAELAYMRQAATIVDQALQNGIAEIAEGVRQCDVAARISHDLIAGTPECGGSASSKPLTMPTGPGVAQAPHLKWTDDPFRPGDQTDFEVGAFVHRYCCALSRTSFLGDPTLRVLEVHEGVVAGFEAALAAIRPGASCGDVHRAFQAEFAPRGICKESRIGYSIGIEWPDLCFSLQGDSTTVLETDYTMHLIIGIWEKTDACVFSETIRVGETAGESLSRTPRQLFIR